MLLPPPYIPPDSATGWKAYDDLAPFARILAEPFALPAPAFPIKTALLDVARSLAVKESRRNIALAGESLIIKSWSEGHAQVSLGSFLVFAFNVDYVYPSGQTGEALFVVNARRVRLMTNRVRNLQDVQERGVYLVRVEKLGEEIFPDGEKTEAMRIAWYTAYDNGKDDWSWLRDEI